MARKKTVAEVEQASPAPVDVDETPGAPEAEAPAPRKRISGQELAGRLRQERRERRLKERGY